MRLPKRSVFARPRAELTHLYNLFYPINATDPAQADAYRRRGVELVHRIYLSRSSSPCPVAIECTASLIDALLLDSALSHHPTSSSGSAIRSALSLALIRLVNSLADSLQQGVYAKSIASIAERQLGLPQSFVEFRHRATHEDLPSLAVCREAAGAALSWLQVNYWIPSLQALNAERQLQHNAGAATPSRPSTSKPGPSAAESRAAAITSLEPILDSYRRLAKAIARDQSLRSRNRASLEGIAGELEAWKRRTEAALPGRRWAGQAGEEEDESEDDDEDDDGSDDEGGHWLSARRQNKAAAAAPILTAADDILLSSLLKPGIGIVPLAKSKRPRRDLGLSEDIKQTWEYLLERRSELRGQLAQRLTDVLAMSGAEGQGEDEDDERSAQNLLSTDASYARTLQAWLLHLVPQDEKGERPVVDQLLQSLLANDASSAKPQEKKASPALPVLYAFLKRRRERREDVAQLEELLELAERRERERKGEEKGPEEPLLKGFEDMGGNSVAPPPQETGQPPTKENEDLDSLFARMERRQLAFGGPPAPPPPQQQHRVQPVDVDMHVDEGNHDDDAEDEAADACHSPQATALPLGWTLYDEAEWKPTPIGCLAGRVPDFLHLEGPQQHAQSASR